MRSLVGVFMMKQAEGKLDTLHWNYRLYRVTLPVAITPTRVCECVCVCCHKESIVVNCCEAGTGGSLSSSASIHCVCPWKVAVAGGRPQGCAELLSSQHWTLSSLLGRSLSLKENIPAPCHLLISRLCDWTNSSQMQRAGEMGSTHYVIRLKLPCTAGKWSVQPNTYFRAAPRSTSDWSKL